MPKSKRLQRIDDDDIQIAMDAAMLKRIVEQNQLAIEFLDRHLRGGDAIGILNVRHVGELLLQFESFVVPRPGFGAVAAADDRHPHAALPEPAGQPFDQRRFARAAKREIPDADHRHRDALDRLPAAIVLPIPPLDGQRIRHFRRSQQTAQQRGLARRAAGR